MARFQRAFDILGVHEGGYVNHPKDPGGATNKGVTQRTYDAHRKRQKHPKKDVRYISDLEVRSIYKNQYWNTVRAEDLPQGVGYCVFDAGVNSGPSRAVKWLQEVIGAKADGIVGNETISKVREMKSQDVINAYCDKRLAFMKSLAHWSSFKNGWTRRVAEVRKQSLTWADDDTPNVAKEAIPAKAEGEKSTIATLKEAIKDPSAIGAAGSTVAAAGTLFSGSGPVQYALGAVLVLAALTGIWWLVKGRHA